MEEIKSRISSELIDRSRIDYLKIDNRVLSQAEVSAILYQLRYNYHHQLIFKLAVSTGMRPEEIAEIRLKDLNPENQSISIKNTGECKTEWVERVIGLHPSLFMEIMRYARSNKTYDYLFIGRGENMSWRSIAYILQKPRSSVPGKLISIRTFQDSAAICFLQNGVSTFELGYLLGHNNWKSLKRRLKKIAGGENGRIELFNSIFLKTA